MHRSPTEGNLYEEEGKFKNLSMLETTIGTWTMLTNGTG